MAISGIISSSSREVPYAPASVSGSDVGTARAYNNASATISFTFPVHDGGLPVTSYTVTSNPGGFTASGSSSPLTITGLSSSTNYVYSVTATNAIGTGPNIVSGFVFATTIPQPATIGTATATGVSGTVSVGFTANGTGGKTVTYTATSSPGGLTGSSSSSPVSVSGLTNGTAYTFTVVASNANGSASASGASNSATPYIYVAPSGPIGSSSPTVSVIGLTTVRSSSGAWGAGTTPTSYTYNLYRSDGTYIATSGSQSTSVTSWDFDASYSTSYYVTVTASNSYGSGTMTSNTVTTGAQPPADIAPGVPRSLYVTANSSSTGGVYGFSAPSTGTFPMTVYYDFILQYAGPIVSSSVTFDSSSESSPVFSTSSNGFYALTAYASNNAGTSASVRAPADGYTPFQYSPVVAPGSMDGLVSGYYSGGTLYYNWSAPTGTGPFTYYYTFGGATYSTSSTSTTNFQTSATITVYASNSAGSGASGSAYASAPPVVVAPGSMAGLVSGYYAGQSYFNWSAPTGTAPFTYYYSYGGTTYSTTGTSATTSGYASISVYANNSAGSGGSGSYSLSAPAAPYQYNCTTSSPCAGVGNCTYTNPSSNTSGSGTGYSTNCFYNNTNTYPSCQSTAGAGCTTNLACCSVATIYKCTNYDVTNPASPNYVGHCYSVGQCDASSNVGGGRTPCCPTAC